MKGVLLCALLWFIWFILLCFTLIYLIFWYFFFLRLHFKFLLATLFASTHVFSPRAVQRLHWFWFNTHTYTYIYKIPNWNMEENPFYHNSYAGKLIFWIILWNYSAAFYIKHSVLWLLKIKLFNLCNESRNYLCHGTKFLFNNCILVSILFLFLDILLYSHASQCCSDWKECVYIWGEG